MIATLEGIVSEKIGQQAVISIGGIGYGALLTTNDLDSLVIGDKTKVYIYENIKEDAHDLFGFTSLDNKNLFEQLLSVKNVGPKVAMSLLELGNANDVRSLIAGGNVKGLQSAKGVGKRAAEQIVVELRDKVGLIATDSAEDVVNRGGVDANDEATMALISLGFSESDAVIALKDIDNDLPTEHRIKMALKAYK